MKGNWKKIGIVGKAHGLRGAFFVGGRSSLLPNTYSDIVLGDKPQTGLHTQVTNYQICKNRVLLSLSALPDRTRVEFFAGQSLWVTQDTAELSSDTQLIGREVVDCAGEPMGRICDLFNYGASDTVQIIADDKRTLEIPFVGSYFADTSTKDHRRPMALNVPRDTFADLWEEAPQ
jgi:ribosomal 30S subunit maturation factor RimM